MFISDDSCDRVVWVSSRMLTLHQTESHHLLGKSLGRLLRGPYTSQQRLETLLQTAADSGEKAALERLSARSDGTPFVQGLEMFAIRGGQLHLWKETHVKFLATGIETILSRDMEQWTSVEVCSNFSCAVVDSKSHQITRSACGPRSGISMSPCRASSWSTTLTEQNSSNLGQTKSSLQTIWPLFSTFRISTANVSWYSSALKQPFTVSRGLRIWPAASVPSRAMLQSTRLARHVSAEKEENESLQCCTPTYFRDGN